MKLSTFWGKTRKSRKPVNFIPRLVRTDDTVDLVPWLERNRSEIEGSMHLLDCRAHEAVTIMLLNTICNRLADLVDEDP